MPGVVELSSSSESDEGGSAVCTTANRQTSMVDFFTLVEKKKKRGRPKGSTAVRRGPNVSRKNTGAPNKAAEASYEAPKQSMRGKRKTNEKASHCPGCQWARAGGLHSHHCLQP